MDQPRSSAPPGEGGAGPVDTAAPGNPDKAPRTERGRRTLRKLLETVADYDRRVEVAIETKHPTRYGGLVEKRLVEMLRDFGWHEAGAPVRVMSFSFTALQRVERLAPEVQLVQLVDKPNYWQMLRRVIGRDWIVGRDVTNADLSCCGYLYYPEPFGFDRKDWPNIDAWLTRLSEQPGWKHPYDLMPGSPADRA